MGMGYHGVDAAKISEAGKYAKIELNQYTCCEGERGGETTVCMYFGHAIPKENNAE